MPSVVTSCKVVTFGGTGKTVALVYMKLCRIIGYRPDVVVVDFPPGGDPNSNDGQLDTDLGLESGGAVARISTLPANHVLDPVPLTKTFNLPAVVADSLFTSDQQHTPPTEGLNAEPQVGACVAHLKLKEDGNSVRQAILSGKDDIFLVAGLGGGTGAGVTMPFAEFLREAPAQRHGVFLLPWRNIGEDGTVTNTQQMRNAASVLSYLKDKGQECLTDCTVVGSLPGMELYLGSAEEGHRATHPTLILAALSIIMHDAWGAGSGLTVTRRRIETEDTGIRLQDIGTPQPGKSLYEMLVLSWRKIRILEILADEDPDQLLAWFSFAPLSNSIACAPLRWLLKLYAHQVHQSSYPTAWNALRECLRDQVRADRANLEWICGLAADGRLFDFDANQLERDGIKDFATYLGMVRRSRRHEEFRIKANSADDALEQVRAFVVDRVIHETLLLPPERS